MFNIPFSVSFFRFLSSFRNRQIHISEILLFKLKNWNSLRVCTHIIGGHEIFKQAYKQIKFN